MKKTFLVILLILFIIPISFSLMSSSSINWLSRNFADLLYAPIDPNANDLQIYLNQSYSTNVHYYINKSDQDNIDIYVEPGKKSVYGDELV